MPLSLKQIDKIHTPERFFLEDPLNPGVFDQPHLEETYSSGKGLRRRAKPKATDPDVPVDQTANARLEKITGKQHFFVDGYYDGDLIYTWELIPEYWDGNSWEFQELAGVVDIDNEAGVMTCVGVQGNFSWDIQIGFTADNNKWSIYITAPGFLVRVRQEIVFTALGQQMVADGDLVLDYSDFTGNVSDDEGVATRTIIYEPNGVDATSGWTVDPYLSVDTTTTTWKITGDGWIQYISSSTTDNFLTLYNTSGPTETYRGALAINTAAGTYSLGYDTDRVMTLIQSSPTFVHVKVSGNLEDSLQATMSNSVSFVIDLYHYVDRVIMDVTWVTETSNIVVQDQGNFNNSLLTFEDRVTATSWKEDAGSETEDGWGEETSSSTDYLACKATEMNILLAWIYDSTGDYKYWINGTGDITARWNDHTFAPGTHRAVMVVFIDSADRENDGGTFKDWDTDVYDGDVVLDPVPVGYIVGNDGLRWYCHTSHTPATTNEPGVGANEADYWWEYRMTLGNQYNDTTMAGPDGTGDWVTGQTDPLTIGVDGFASDGAWHVDGE